LFFKVVMWKPLGSTESCLLLEALVDLEDEKLRTKILQTAVNLNANYLCIFFRLQAVQKCPLVKKIVGSGLDVFICLRVVLYQLYSQLLVTHTVTLSHALDWPYAPWKFRFIINCVSR